jgi:hypothetical protein
MNIVWIHGMNQQHKTARTLLQHWLVILQQVLSKLGRADDLPIFSGTVGWPFTEIF